MLTKPTIQRNINSRVNFKPKAPVFSVDNPFTVSKKKQKSLNLFWYGFLLSIISYYFSTTDDKYIGAALCQAFQILGYIIMIVGATELMKFKFDDKYLENIFRVYFFYTLTIIVRGVAFDFNSLKKLFLDVTYGVIPYFVPLVVLLPRNIATYKKAFTIILILGASFIICSLIFIDIILDEDWMNTQSLVYMENLFGFLAFSSGFILLTYLYHTKPKLLFSFLVLAVSLYFLIYRARRGSMFLCLTTILGAGMVYLIGTKKKALIIFMAVILVFLSTVFMSGMKVPGMFDHLEKRGDEDTRSGVEQYMSVSMTSRDWLIGKGINGNYYCPIVINVNDPSGYRDVIETGYLQIILKGGILSLGLLLAVLIPALYRGLFKSINILSKGAGMFILLWIVYLYPTIGTGFSMHFVLLWLCVGICYSKKITGMDDMEIKNALNKQKG
ncbi:hypothetical protein [Ferruginibacter sp.]